jgi:gliding motility-associated transport system permease protein
MRVFCILLGKELRQFFLSPLAYVVLVLFMLISGVSFYAAVSVLTRTTSAGSLVTFMFGTVGFYISFFAVFPLITMRLVAEERKLGTIETMLTAPVRASQLVLSKYAAAVIFYIVLWIPSLANLAIFQFISGGAAALPRGPLIGSYTIVLLVGLFYLAMGLFASSLTRNQIIAAVLALAMILVHFLVGFIAVKLSSTRLLDAVDFFIYFASIEHLELFTSGLIDTRPIVYYLSLAAFFLVLSHQVLEFRRWKT